ncbi:MAG TPA: polyphosphate polymerase domain-containing protein [Bacteroidales bacterium]|nr:polyphosphate polymerase domain-containing protein [Bacteroidales bacterium]
MNSSVPDISLEGYHTISLEEVMRASLAERMEQKYILPAILLPDLLQMLKKDFDLMVVGGQPVQLYESVYFDTPALSTYLAHHNGIGDRFKIRLRKYHSTSTSFLEIKHRIPTGKVIKKRIQVSDLMIDLSMYSEFLRCNSPYQPEELEEKIRSYYYRITLVNKVLEERATFDYGLLFTRGNERQDFSPLVIAEFKFSKDLRRPSCQDLLRSFHIRNTSISKYCTGIASLYQDVRKNRFKQNLRKINRIIVNHYENHVR